MSMDPHKEVVVSPEATEERSDERAGGGTTTSALSPGPDSEVEARPARRRFTAKYKLSILEQIEACSSREEAGALLRREGLYSSHISAWRAAHRKGALSGLGKKRGRKPKQNPLGRKLALVERENARLKDELRKAQLIIDVQVKVATLLGIPLEGEKNS